MSPLSFVRRLGFFRLIKRVLAPLTRSREKADKTASTEKAEVTANENTALDVIRVAEGSLVSKPLQYLHYFAILISREEEQSFRLV